MDIRGDLRYDVKGHPIDLTKQDPKRTRFDNSRMPYRASALYSGGGEPSSTIPRQEWKSQRNFQQGPKTAYKQEVGQQRGDNRQEPWPRPRGPELLCESCNTKGHFSLFNCPEFPEYIPRGTNVKSLPKGVCPKCLSYYMNCDHRQFRGFEDYLCKKNDVNFLVCNQCIHHTTVQNWVRKNFNPSRGKKILGGIRANVPNYHATINSIRVK